MNIFILDRSPILAARAQHDRHVVKMILESCQMLSTAAKFDTQHSGVLWQNPIQLSHEETSLLYKDTHVNHPSSIWVRTHPANFAWLVIHLDALLAEYHHRFPGKSHKCDYLKFTFAGLAARLCALPPPSKPHRVNDGFYFNDSGKLAINPAIIDYAMSHHTPFVYCGPDEYTVISDNSYNSDIIESYRRYYLAEKALNNRWTHPTYMPDWLALHASIHLPERGVPSRHRATKSPRPFVIPPPCAQTSSVSKFLARLSPSV